MTTSANPQNIYRDVELKIDSILQEFEKTSKENIVNHEFGKAIQILTPHAEKLKAEIHSLEDQAEWNTFVMAFYGETNAGKSTIIEALRILLKEPSKIAEQEQFKAFQNKHNITEQHLKELQTAIAVTEHELATAEKNVVNTQRENQSIIDRDSLEIEVMTKKIERLKQTASIWKKIIWMFKKMPELGELANLEINAGENLIKIKDAEISVQQKLKTAKKNQQSANEEANKAEEHKKQLAVFADGAIIGNGKSDFTMKTQEYRFSANGQEFILLDVPGIEGNEDKVIDSVQNAVKKAHAVFYVTGKAAPPQKGDGEKKGTLEKIKQHLNAQTEVWSVYNKRITNQMQLENGLNISVDEQASLNELDSKMSEQLANNYKHTISLSAYPAFLAAANHLVPGSHFLNGKEKFVKHFSGKDILEKTGMNRFYRFIAIELVKNAEKKIFASNYTKAKCIVGDTNLAIFSVLDQSLLGLQNKLSSDAENARQQLSIEFQSLKSRIRAVGDNVIDEFAEDIRQKMYREIEEDINNDDFKDAFERLIQNGRTSLSEEFSKKIAIETKRFEQKISDIMERYKELAQDSIESYSHINVNGIGAGIDLKIDINNGVNVPKLLIAAIGGALMIWNPSGWIVLALGAFTLIASVYKALKSMFSADYRKSQQRESVNKNLDELRSNMYSSVQNSLDQAFSTLSDKFETLDSVVSEPVNQVNEMVNILTQARDYLNQIEADIEAQICKKNE